MGTSCQQAGQRDAGRYKRISQARKLHQRHLKLEAKQFQMWDLHRLASVRLSEHFRVSNQIMTNGKKTTSIKLKTYPVLFMVHMNSALHVDQ